MAFLRVRGQSVSLVHGERHEDLGVRHKRLHTFPGGLAGLREELKQDAWSRLQILIEQRVILEEQSAGAREANPGAEALCPPKSVLVALLAPLNLLTALASVEQA